MPVKYLLWLSLESLLYGDLSLHRLRYKGHYSLLKIGRRGCAVASCGAVVPGTHELLQDLAASKVALSHAHSVEHTLRQELTRVKQKAAVKVTLYPCNPTPCPDPITPL